ncbi:GRAM domain-containing 3 [Brachionus plicatilis]|uniref:GRAM domain-containing 3 n=1 Tax=Brachionus plicatilis TaxID=10195 RepID=A0A3M7P2H0_BRAPC|nr:GRAM domain-containing 3 [Brachionus plicatilis]
MPAATESRKTKKSKKNSKKCNQKDPNTDKDLNNNKKIMERVNFVQEYSSIQSNSTVSLNNANNSCSSNSSTITSPETSLIPANSASTPVKPKTTSKSNVRFHQLFPSISLDEIVISTYSCAYVKSLNLYQGVMFLTNNYICFYSKILNHENILILKLTHVNSIVKTMHALIFPTAIRIQTKNSTYSFTSFRSRGNTLDHLHNLLQNSRQLSLMFDFLQRQIDQMSKIGLSENSNLNFSIMDYDGEKNPDEINKIEEYKKKLDDDTTSINRTISESNFSDNSSPDLIKICRKKSNRLENRKANSTHFTSPHIPKQQANNLSYVLDFKNNTVIVSLKHKKTLFQRAKILLSLFIPGFFDISRIDALLPICFLMSILLLLNAFVLLSKVNQVDDIFNQLLIKNEL